MSFNLSLLSDNVQDLMTDSGTSLEDKITSFDPETATSADLIALQYDLTKHSLTVSIGTNSLKSVSDGLKGVVANFK